MSEDDGRILPLYPDPQLVRMPLPHESVIRIVVARDGKFAFADIDRGMIDDEELAGFAIRGVVERCDEKIDELGERPLCAYAEIQFWSTSSRSVRTTLVTALCVTARNTGAGNDRCADECVRGMWRIPPARLRSGRYH